MFISQLPSWEWIACWNSGVSLCHCIFRLLPSQCDPYLPQFTITQTNNDVLRHATHLHNKNIATTRLAAHLCTEPCCTSLFVFIHTHWTDKQAIIVNESQIETYLNKIRSFYDSWSSIIILLCMFTITILRNYTD